MPPPYCGATPGMGSGGPAPPSPPPPPPPPPTTSPPCPGGGVPGPPGCAPPAGAPLPPSPTSPASERSVPGDTEKDADTLLRNGSNGDVLSPTGPRHRSWVVDRLNPGRRSEAKVFVIDWVCHPVRPGIFACSRL